jgi:glycosyltransferase involved in cell wall biosynthesis/ubiquinone/menaquinone biosynthesis C-methylase UbiE
MRVAMLLHKSVEHDSRVRREAKALAEAGDEVVVLELAPVPADATLDGFRRRSVLSPSWVRRALPLQSYRLAFAAKFVRAISDERPDVIHAHDAAMLLPGLFGRRLTGAALVYDSHELATGVPYRDKRWARFVSAIEALALPRCAAVITVSDGIAAHLQARYRLDATPAVVRNVADGSRGEISRSGLLRAAIGVSGEPLVLHQGSVAPGRGAEILVRAMAQLPDAQLAFLGVDDAYRPGLLQASRSAGVADRVHLLPPVPVGELLKWTADADVGVSLLDDSCDNHRLALPNKVFEYVAAGVPVVASDLPELRRLIVQEGVGWLASGRDAASLASALRQAIAAGRAPETRERLSAARDRLRWDVEKQRLLALYGPLRTRGEVRLRRVYSAYLHDEAKQLAWSSDNPGNRAIRGELLEAVLRWVGERPNGGADLLDVGCGTGWLLRALVARGFDPSRLTGIEELDERAQRARAAVPGAQIVKGDAARLPLPSDSFDAVTLLTVLSSIPKGARRTVVEECVRVLRPGGLLLVYDGRLPYPLNHSTTRVAARDVQAERLQILARESLTVAPPIARRLGRWTPRAYPLLARVPALRSHRLIIGGVPA